MQARPDIVRLTPVRLACHLTPRQRAVLTYVADGETTKAIASLMRLSPKTVEYHRARLMSRAQIYDIASLTKLAIRLGLTQL